MSGLAIHLSVVVLTALLFILTEAVAMVIDTEPPELFFKITEGIMAFYLGFSFLIALSLIWG